MDFFTRHYEKLILGFCLICFMWSMFSVQRRVNESASELNKVKRSVSSLVTGKKYYAEVKTSDFMRVTDLDSNDNMVMRFDVNLYNVKATRGEDFELDAADYHKQSEDEWQFSSLLQPARYIICKNPSCYTILPFGGRGEMTCPYCGERQEITAPEPTMTDDLDKDGIPDYIEKQYDFLDYHYYYDAFDDEDGDGFTNIEEYLAGTDMTDFNDCPDLGYAVRLLGQPFNQPIPFMFNRIKKPANTPVKSDWKAVFDRAGEAKVGEPLSRNKAYVLADIDGENNNVTITTPRGESIVMERNKPATEKAISVRLCFMTSRFGIPVVKEDPSRQAPAGRQPRNARGGNQGTRPQSQDRVLNVRVGEEFTLTVDKSGIMKTERVPVNDGVVPAVVEEVQTVFTEYYRLASVENNMDASGQPVIKVYIEKLTRPGGAREKMIEVRAYNPKVDSNAGRRNVQSVGGN